MQILLPPQSGSLKCFQGCLTFTFVSFPTCLPLSTDLPSTSLRKLSLSGAPLEAFAEIMRASFGATLLMHPRPSVKLSLSVDPSDFSKVLLLQSQLPGSGSN